MERWKILIKLWMVIYIMKIKKKVDWKVACTAIVCLSVLEIVAIQNGINGTMRSIIFALIALIVGVQLPQVKLK